MMSAMDDSVTLRLVAEDDLPILERLTQNPDTTGEFAWFGWYQLTRFHHWRNRVSWYHPNQANSPVVSGFWVNRSRIGRSSSATSRSVTLSSMADIMHEVHDALHLVDQPGGAGGTALPQRDSMLPNRHTARAPAHTTTNSTAIVSPALLMSKFAMKSQNGPCRCSSSVSSPMISTVPIRNAAAIDSPVMTRL